MNPINQTMAPLNFARTAGLVYLVIIVCGIGGEAILRGPLIIPGNPGLTVANLVGSELPFRLSIMADVIMALTDVALAVMLYFLLKPVGRTLSLMAMAFRLVQAAILGLNLLNLYTAIGIATNNAFEFPGRDDLVMSHLKAHSAGYDFGLFFFGINCILVGALVLRSGFFPRLLGVGILASAVVYLVGSTVRVAVPGLHPWVAPAYLVPLVAETAFCLWLIFKGLDAERWKLRASGL